MRNVLKKMMGVKFHITSYRVWALRPFKRDVLGAQKFNFLQIAVRCNSKTVSVRQLHGNCVASRISLAYLSYIFFVMFTKKIH